MGAAFSKPALLSARPHATHSPADHLHHNLSSERRRLQHEIAQYLRADPAHATSIIRLDNRSGMGRLSAAADTLFSADASSPFRVRCVGGSITDGSGSTFDMPAGGVAQPFPEVLAAELQHMAPHRRPDVQKYGTSGFGSRYHGSCISSVVPNGTDLVILDVSLTDMGYMPSRSRNYAGLVSTLLDRLHVGTVLTLNWRDHTQRSTVGDENALIAVALSRQLPSTAVLTVWREMDAIGLTRQDRKHLWAGDGRHPSYQGHQLIGKLIASLLLEAVEAPPAPPPPLGVSGRNGSRRSPTIQTGMDSTCIVGEGLAALAPSVPSTADAAHGDTWRWVDESKEGRHRWGFVAHRRPGANLSLYPSRAGKVLTGSSLGPSALMWLELGYLQSYGDWGEFTVSCAHPTLARCTCEAAQPWPCRPSLKPATLADCRRGLEYPRVQSRIERNVSIWGSTTFMLRGGPSCLTALEVRVTALAKGKVKVIGLKVHSQSPFF